MTNKLVVIINSLTVPKVKKILLYEMKFLVPNYSCLQNPWLGGYRPQIPFSLSSTEFVEPPSPKKILGTPLHPTQNSLKPTPTTRHCVLGKMQRWALCSVCSYRHVLTSWRRRSGGCSQVSQNTCTHTREQMSLSEHRLTYTSLNTDSRSSTQLNTAASHSSESHAGTKIIPRGRIAHLTRRRIFLPANWT